MAEAALLQGKLRWVELAQKPLPLRGKKPRLSRLQRAGLAYEKRVVRQSRRWWPKATVLHNPWIRFEDALGIRYCCPDVVVLAAEGGWVLEAKLSWSPYAEDKLLGLYVPLCEALWERDFFGAAVCSSWRPEAEGEPLGSPTSRKFSWVLWS